MSDSPGEGSVPEGRGLRCGHWTVPSPEGVEPRHERRVVLEAATTNEGRDRWFVCLDLLGRFQPLFTVRIKRHRTEQTYGYCKILLSPVAVMFEITSQINREEERKKYISARH